MNPLDKALAVAAHTGGGTFEVRTAEPVTHGGYVVAWDVGGVIAPTLDEFIRNVESYVAQVAPCYYIGVWVADDGRVYLDPVEIMQDRDRAIAHGRAWNQISIYDLARNEEIPTGGTGE